MSGEHGIRGREAPSMSHVLYLIRHGRSDFDSSEMSATARGDQWDPPLSEEGRRQAELLAHASS